MAGELQADHLTGRPVYFLIRDTTSRIWNGAAFESYSTLNYANYYISGAEQGATGYFTASAPAMAAGLYYYLAKDRQGASPAEGDPTVTAGDLQWTGSGVQGVYLCPVTPLSGAFTVASLNSGQQTVPYSGQLSGQPFTLASGTTFLASGSITSGVIASGIYVTATAAVGSGLSVIASLYSGQQVILYSGSFSGQPVNATATVNSGLSVIATLYSGQSALLYSGQFSGQPVSLASGTTYLASGQRVQLYSGALSEVLTYNFSGLAVNSGTRCLLNASRKLINDWNLTDNSGYLTVYQENDATVAYKQAVTTASGAEPVTGLNT